MLYPIFISGVFTRFLLLFLPDGIPFLMGLLVYGLMETLLQGVDFNSITLLIASLFLTISQRFPPPFQRVVPPLILIFTAFLIRPNAPPVTYLYALLLPVLFSLQRKRFGETTLFYFTLLLLIGGFLFSTLLTLPYYFLFASPWLGYAFCYRKPPVWVQGATLYFSFLYLGLR